MATSRSVIQAPIILALLWAATPAALAQEVSEVSVNASLVLDLRNDRKPQARIEIDSPVNHPGGFELALPFPIRNAETSIELFNTWGSFGDCCSLLAFPAPVAGGRMEAVALTVEYANPPDAGGRRVDPASILTNPVLIREGLTRTLVYDRNPDRQLYRDMLESTSAITAHTVVVMRPRDSEIREIGDSGRGTRPEPISRADTTGFVFNGTPVGDEPSQVVVRYEIPSNPAQEQLAGLVGKLSSIVVPAVFATLFTRVSPSGRRTKRIIFYSLMSVSVVALVAWVVFEFWYGFNLSSLLEILLFLVGSAIIAAVGYVKYLPKDASD